MTTCVETSGKAQLEYDPLGKENDGIVGMRVRFKATNGPRSKLRFNDLGTIAAAINCSNWTGRQTKLWVRWDKDDNYTLMDNFDSLDVFKEAGI
jgi:hypothetical protein